MNIINFKTAPIILLHCIFGYDVPETLNSFFLEVTGLPMCSFVTENERKLAFRKVKSEVEELPPTNKDIEIHRNQLFLQVKLYDCKISKLLHGGIYIHTLGINHCYMHDSETAFCRSPNRTQHRKERAGPSGRAV